MWNKNLPRNHFLKSNFAHLEASAEGQPMALNWGVIKNFTPVCRDTVALEYQFNDGAVDRIDKVTADGKVLVVDVDYTDLGDGAIRWGTDPPGTSELTPSLYRDIEYFLVIESDYPIGANYLGFGQSGGEGGYANGKQWYMDENNVWTEFSLVGRNTTDMILDIRGNETIMPDFQGGESLRIKYPASEDNWKPWNEGFKLRDENAHTKIAQSFKITDAGGPWYAVVVWCRVDKTRYLVGSGTTRAYFTSSVGGLPGIRIGAKSRQMWLTQHVEAGFFFDQREGRPGETPETATPPNILVDFRGRKYAVPPATPIFIGTVGKIIPDAYVNILKGELADLGDLTDLETLPQTLAIPLESEISFGSLVDKLEAGQQFKMVWNLDGKFTLKVFTDDEPIDVLKLFDEDMMEFKSFRKLTGCVFGKVRVGYDMDLALGEYKFAEAKSDIASLIYRCEETLLFETFLDVASDAQTLANVRMGQVEFPAHIISFNLSGGKGSDKIPGDKIKVYRTHADYTGGTMPGVLFRIISIAPNFSNDTVAVTAQLDTQTY